MGRIKSTLVKRTAKQIINKDKNFTDQFDYNKKLLGQSMPSKKIRNKIAGYMARLACMEKERILQEQKKQVQAPAVNETPEYDIQQA